MPEEHAPPVVAVVVSADPGPWLEECLEALNDQDYANLSLLVVDAGSAEPIAGRVAAVEPGIFLRRLADNAGFGPSANSVLELVEGASYFLFCHDDVVPAPDAVTRLVEESFRSNAGVVGPKLVDKNEPDLILQLGLHVDRFGAPVRRVEHREFDQAQHDEAREVFAVPGACTLVRADLFALLGGFDPAISMFGEDVDLCWRAHLAGARVVVAPAASVAHLEATASRRRPLPEARALQWRHELRAVLKDYRPLRRSFIVAQLGVLSLAEVVYFLLLGRRRRVQAVLDAWRWNFARRTELAEARAALEQIRRVPDREVARLFSGRTFRLWRFARPRLEERLIRWHAERGNLTATRVADRRATHRAKRPREVTLAAIAAAVVLVFGSRLILTGHLPLVGGFAPLPSPTHLLGTFLGGTTDAGMQHPGPATPAFGVLGLGGLVALGGMGVVLKAILVAAVVLGAIGVARLARPFGPPGARLVAALAYLFLPLAWDDVARGDLLGLIAYGAMPWICLRLSQATGARPFATGSVPRLWSAAGARECLSLGLLLGLVGIFVPLLVPLTVAVAATLALGSAAAGDASGGRRALGVGAGGALVALVLALPWSLTYFQPGARLSVLLGAAGSPETNPTLSALLRFDLGPIGKGLLGYAILAAALLVLLVGKGDRFAWATRWWIAVLGTAALAWAASEGWLGAGGGDLAVLITPTATLVATLVGLGAASLMSDLASTSFGWRHFVTAAFAICAVAGLLPVLGASLGGRWGLPATGYDSVLSWTAGSGPEAGTQRQLWVGDPASLPMRGWQVMPGLAAAVSEGGLPDGTRLWPSPHPGQVADLVTALDDAASGNSVRLGAVLARSGIRYLVVPTSAAPEIVSGSATVRPVPQELLDGLAAQADLHELPSEGGALVFESTAWRPGVVVPPAVARSAATPSWLRELAVIAELALLVALGADYLRRRPSRSRRRSRPGAAATSPEADGTSPEAAPELVGAALPGGGS